jgi:hypothetical protein
MNHLKQVAWNTTTDKRLAALEELYGAIKAVEAEVMGLIFIAETHRKRIEELEAKRGPGRPRLVRPKDPASDD